MIVAKVTSKGQVTIPKKIREFLEIDAQDKIEFTLLEKGKVLITGEQKSAKALFGMLKHRKQAESVSVDQMDEAVRDRRKKVSVL